MHSIEQLGKLFYDHFENAAQELQALRKSKKNKEMQSLHGLIDELEASGQLESKRIKKNKKNKI